MQNKIILGLIFVLGITFTALAQSDLKEIITNAKTGEQDFYELKPFRSSTTPNAADFRVLMPKKSDSKIYMENKASGYTINNILFGKTVSNGNTATYWIEVSALQMGGIDEEVFYSITKELLQTLYIDSSEGILTFNIKRSDVQQFLYGIREVNNGVQNSWATYYLRERVRINLTEQEFNNIRKHGHLGFQVETSAGLLVPMVFEKKAWLSVQDKLNKLYEISYP